MFNKDKKIRKPRFAKNNTNNTATFSVVKNTREIFNNKNQWQDHQVESIINSSSRDKNITISNLNKYNNNNRYTEMTEVNRNSNFKNTKNNSFRNGPRNNSSERPRRDFGDKPRSFGDRPRKDFGDKPRSFGDRPRKDFGDKPRSFGDRPRKDFGDKPRSFGDRPRKDFGDKPRSFGDKPRKDFGDKPRSFGDRPRKDFGDKPRSFGDRPRKDFGDKPKDNGFNGVVEKSIRHHNTAKYNINSSIELQRATEGSAGFDIKSNMDHELQPNDIKLISTGLMLEMPIGIEGQIRIRSSLASQGIMILNAPGTIDWDYRGEVKVILGNFSDKSFSIHEGDRIAQLVFNHVVIPTINGKSQSFTAKRSGGFGSTGI